jgi:hypothetical protein
VVLIVAQGSSLLRARQLFVLGLLAVVTVLLVAGAMWPERENGTAMLGAATGGLLVLGVLAIFSIGLPLLLAAAAGLASTVASARLSRSPAIRWAAAAVAGSAVTLLSFGVQAGVI